MLSSDTEVVRPNRLNLLMPVEAGSLLHSNVRDFKSVAPCLPGWACLDGFDAIRNIQSMTGSQGAT